MKSTRRSTDTSASYRRLSDESVSSTQSSLAICPPRILLTDDDAGVRESLAAALRCEGYLVETATNGREALNAVEQGKIDLVLLDLNMPIKGGWDTFERLTTKNPLLPVVIITARPNQLFTAVSAGVGALLEKPLEIPQLLRTIRVLLNEAPEARLARLTGRETTFHYSPQGQERRGERQ